MARNELTSELIDELLRATLTGGVVMTTLITPGSLPALDKVLNKALGGLDKRAHEREVRRLVRYMKYQKLISENYEHGLTVTKEGRKRLRESEFRTLAIPVQAKWDKLWRIVFYDIPETKKEGRKAFTSKLNELGFYQLQKSVWVHPLPCRLELEKVSTYYAINKYVSYVEASHIDNQQALIKIFKTKLPNTKFK